MKHLQTKSDLMCDLEHAIGTKDAFMESLGKQSRRVKLEIQSAMSALYSALRAREMWLLNQVDVIASSQESLLRKQQSILYELVWLLSHTNTDYIDISTAISKLEEYHHCPSVDLSFLSNAREIKQQLLNFGTVKGGNTLQEIGQEQAQFENTRQQDKRDISARPFQFDFFQNKPFRVVTEESSQTHESVKCNSPSSFRFDFTANKFIQTSAGGGLKDNECFSLSESSSDHKVVNSSGSFYFDFSANKFIQTTANGQKDTECISSSETEQQSSFANVKSPGSFRFDFNTNRFIKADEDDTKCEQTSSTESKLSSMCATNVSPHSFRFDFTAKKFIQTCDEHGSKDVAFCDTTSTTPISSSGEETANVEHQSTSEVPSFRFCFNENKSVLEFPEKVDDEAYESNDLIDQSDLFSRSDSHLVAKGDMKETSKLNAMHDEDPLSTSQENKSICSFYFDFTANKFVPVLN